MSQARKHKARARNIVVYVSLSLGKWLDNVWVLVALLQIVQTFAFSPEPCVHLAMFAGSASSLPLQRCLAELRT